MSGWRRRTMSRWARLAALGAWTGAAHAAAGAAVEPETVALALRADEIASLPASADAAGSDVRGWPRLARPAAYHKTRDAFPGTDLLLRGDGARVEALLSLGPGADASVIELAIPDATAFEISGAGHAIVRAAGGDVVLLRPGLHEEAPDGRRAVAGAWEDRGEGRVGLQVGGRDGGAALAAGFRVLFLPRALAAHDRNRDGRLTLAELAPAAEEPDGGPAVTATKRDTLVADVDGDTQADPGDTLRYDVVIGNSGSSATGVQLADPLDPNLTLVPGSVNVSPLALDDVYAAIANVTLGVSNPLAGLFANDNEFLGDTFVLSSPAPGVPTPTAGGGTVTIQADGTFTFISAPGTTAANDSFSYTLADAGGLTGSATVTIGLAGTVWFVDRDAPPGGTGTQASPFDALADVNGAGGAGDPDAPNHVIYLFDRAAAIDYTGGLELESGQRLVGSGIALVVGTSTILPAVTPPTVVNGGGAGLTLASGVRIEGLDVQAANDAAIAGTGALGTVVVNSVALATSAAGGGVALTNQAGTLTFTAGSITGNGSGAGVGVSGGTGTVDLSGATVSKTGGRLVDVQGKTGGAVSIGAVSGTNVGTDAIRLVNNTGGSTFAFSGGLNVTTTNGRGLFADNSGTISIGGSTSAIAATGGAALDVVGTNFAGTAVFATLLSASSGSMGLNLSGMGGGLSVTGGVVVTNPGGVAVNIQFTTVNLTIGGPGLQVSGGGGHRLVVNGSIGTLSFGAANLSGGTEGVLLINSVGGLREFASLQVSGVAGTAFRHAIGGGATTVLGATTITNPGGTAIDIQDANAAVTFGAVTVDKSGTAGLGVNLANNAVAPSFGTLAITTSAGAGLASAASGLSVGGGSIAATGGAAVNATGTAFSASFGSVTSAGSPSSGVSLANCTGTLGMSAGSIAGASGIAFNVTGGSPTVTFGGTVTQLGPQRVVNVQGTTAGLVSVGSAMGGAASTGVNIDAANGNVAFGSLNLGGPMVNQGVTVTGGTGTYSLGTVDIETSGAAGIVATDADGTLAVASGTVEAASGPAISVDGPAGLTTLGMTLTSVSSIGGTANGLVLQDTDGVFTVNGDGVNTSLGGNASGGVIANKSGADGSVTTGIGVYLNNARNVTLRRMAVTGTHENFGIRGLLVDAFRLEHSTVDGTMGTAATLPAPDEAGEGSVYFGSSANNGLTGSSAIVNSVIGGGRGRNVSIINTTNVPAPLDLAVAGDTFGPPQVGHGLAVETRNAGTAATVAVTGSTFNGANGDVAHFVADTGASLDVSFAGNNSTNTLAGGGATFAAHGAMSLVVDGNAFSGAQGHAVTIQKGVTATTLTAGFSNNTIGTAGVPGSGSATGHGLFLLFQDDAAAPAGVVGLTVANNSIRNYFGSAIHADNAGGTFQLNLSLTGNLAEQPNGPGSLALHLGAGAPASADDVDVCAVIGGTGGNANAFAAGGAAVDVQLHVGTAASTMKLPGYMGATLLDVETFVTGNNPGSTVTALVTPPATPANYVGGAGCP